MASKNNHIAAIFDDLTEFFVLQPAIDKLSQNHIPVDIIVPHDSGYNGLAEHTFKAIKDLGYSPLSDAPSRKTYQILLTPYPGLDVVQRLRHVYHIQYPYGALSSKPNPTYLPKTRLEYDAILSFNTFDQSFLDAYGAKVYPIPYWRYHNFSKTPLSVSKPVLLILPTFGADTSCISGLTKSAIKAIKEHYYIITKSHHAVHFGFDGQDALDELKDIADEFYDSDTPIDTLLRKADIVLSDNSGATFEAICAKIPVALFAKDINSRHLKTMNTPQYDWAKAGIIPYTNQASKILPMLLNIKPYIKKQATLRDQIFPPTSQDPFKDFLDIINSYLESDATKDNRKILHDILVQETHNYQQKIQHLEKTVANLTEQNQTLSTYITNLKNSTSWKVTRPLRKLKSRKHNHVQE